MNPPKNHSIKNGVLRVGETRIILSHVTSYRADTSSIILTLPHGQITLNTGAESAEVVALIDEAAWIAGELALNPFRYVPSPPMPELEPLSLSKEMLEAMRP